MLEDRFRLRSCLERTSLQDWLQPVTFHARRAAGSETWLWLPFETSVGCTREAVDHQRLPATRPRCGRRESSDRPGRRRTHHRDPSRRSLLL